MCLLRKKKVLHKRKRLAKAIFRLFPQVPSVSVGATEKGDWIFIKKKKKKKRLFIKGDIK